MYPWIWRHLPGTTMVKAVVAVMLALACVMVLFLWIFPVIAPLLPFQQQTVGG
jgi:hypothetical protein